MSAYRPPRPGDRGGGPGRPRQGGAPLRSPESGSWPYGDYLKKGYFDSQGNLWPDLICGDQIEQLTKALGQKQGQVQLKPAQIRRFYGKAKSIEQKLDSGQSYDTLRSELLTLGPLAANTVARGNALDSFKVFVDRNLSEATKGEQHFRKGFLMHFQSVVALFPYLNKGS